MPKFLEDKLKAEAASKGKTGREADRYVYGAMNNMGAMHGNKITAKGEAMEEKHERDTGGKSDSEPDPGDSGSSSPGRSARAKSSKERFLAMLAKHKGKGH